jgi:hypothetical protein
MNRLRLATAIASALDKLLNLSQLLPSDANLNEALRTRIPWLLVEMIEHVADAFELICHYPRSRDEGRL